MYIISATPGDLRQSLDFLILAPNLEPFKNLSKSYQTHWFLAWCFQWIDFLILAPYMEPFKSLSKSYQNKQFWAWCLHIISQLESQTIPQTNLNSPKYVVNTQQRIYQRGHKLVHKNTGTPRRYHNLMGNAKTQKRI